MEAVKLVKGGVTALNRADVDTDQIIPKQFLKRIERTGFGEFLFYDWAKEPGWNLPANPILATGSNFGCGSSREHAAWALQDYGFDVVIAPSFGDIFFSNAVQVGLVPVTLPADDVKALMAAVGDGDVTIDLESRTIVDPAGRTAVFEMDPFVRTCLLEGLDSIGRTLQHESDITAFEERSPSPLATTAL